MQQAGYSVLRAICTSGQKQLPIMKSYLRIHGKMHLRRNYKTMASVGILIRCMAIKQLHTAEGFLVSQTTCVTFRLKASPLFYLSLIHISEPTRQAEISYAVFC